jgi:hypothetical protein
VSRLNGYRVSRAFVPLLLGTYLVIVFAGMRMGEAEIFPFFKWSLFSASGSLRQYTTLRIDAVDGRALTRPRYYFEMPDTFAAAREHDVSVAKAVAGLARALYAHDRAAESRARTLVEQLYLSDVGAVRYDVVVLTYDPITRWRTGAVRSVHVLATYEKGAAK